MKPSPLFDVNTHADSNWNPEQTTKVLPRPKLIQKIAPKLGHVSTKTHNIFNINACVSVFVATFHISRVVFVPFSGPIQSQSYRISINLWVRTEPGTFKTAFCHRIGCIHPFSVCENARRGLFTKKKEKELTTQLSVPRGYNDAGQLWVIKTAWGSVHTASCGQG